MTYDIQRFFWATIKGTLSVFSSHELYQSNFVRRHWLSTFSTSPLKVLGQFWPCVWPLGQGLPKLYKLGGFLIKPKIHNKIPSHRPLSIPFYRLTFHENGLANISNSTSIFGFININFITKTARLVEKLRLEQVGENAVSGYNIPIGI